MERQLAGGPDGAKLRRRRERERDKTNKKTFATVVLTIINGCSQRFEAIEYSRLSFYLSTRLRRLPRSARPFGPAVVSSRSVPAR